MQLFTAPCAPLLGGTERGAGGFSILSSTLVLRGCCSERKSWHIFSVLVRLCQLLKHADVWQVRGPSVITTLSISVVWIVYSMIPPVLLLWYTFIGRGTTLKMLCRHGPVFVQYLFYCTVVCALLAAPEMLVLLRRHKL